MAPSETQLMFREHGSTSTATGWTTITNRSPAAWSWFGYESPKREPLFYRGQGAFGWRNILRFLLTFPQRDVIERLEIRRPEFVRRCFDWRSAPRWKNGRWKAKT